MRYKMLNDTLIYGLNAVFIINSIVIFLFRLFSVFYLSCFFFFLSNLWFSGVSMRKWLNHLQWFIICFRWVQVFGLCKTVYRKWNEQQQKQTKNQNHYVYSFRLISNKIGSQHHSNWTGGKISSRRSNNDDDDNDENNSNTLTKGFDIWPNFQVITLDVWVRVRAFVHRTSNLENFLIN